MPTVSVQNITTLIRNELSTLGDSNKAPQMQAYMKSSMPFYGVPAPARQSAVRTILNENRLEDRSEWIDLVTRLWREARFREERYAALDVAGHRYYKSFQDTSAIPVYEELIVTGAWWDFVDEIASRRVGPILRTFPQDMQPLLVRWSTDSDMWKRRTSIICQLGSKEETDLTLLESAISANWEDTAFFIRKAIGWALREYAKTDPTWVREFVARHESRLSPLSRKEALKNLSLG